MDRDVGLVQVVACGLAVAVDKDWPSALAVACGLAVAADTDWQLVQVEVCALVEVVDTGWLSVQAEVCALAPIVRLARVARSVLCVGFGLVLVVCQLLVEHQRLVGCQWLVGDKG